MGRVSELTKRLQGHDRYLYAQETKLGRIDVYRKSQYGEHPPHFVMALTDNWGVNGTPVPWGIEVVLERIKAHDLWRDDTFVERWLAENDKVEESKARDRRNNVESFLYDFRRQFQRATNDINTSLLSKIPERNSYGYC